MLVGQQQELASHPFKYTVEHLTDAPFQQVPVVHTVQKEKKKVIGHFRFGRRPVKLRTILQACDTGHIVHSSTRISGFGS